MDRKFWSTFYQDENRGLPKSFSFNFKGSLPALGKLPRAQLWKESKSSELGCKNEKDIRFCLSLQHHPKLPPEENYSHQRDCTCFRRCPALQEIMTSYLKKFDQFLSRQFRYLGCFVANHTGYFIIIPILLAFLSGTGIQHAKYVTDPEYLFSPVSGPAKNERAFLNEQFYMNYSKDFDPSRITNTGRFIRYIVTARDGGSIMRQDIWNDIIKLDKNTKEFTIYYGNGSFSYKDLCAIWSGKCYEDNILGLNDLIPEIINGSLEVSYPVMVSPYSFDVYILSIFFGGVTLSENGSVSDVKALLLNFWLKSETEEEDKKAQLWEVGLISSFTENDYQYIKAARFTSKTLEDELEVNTRTVIPYIGITVSMTIVFSVSSLLMTDWVRAKPYMGIVGILSTLFASATAFGMVMYAGIPFIGIILASPFLMLGIGVDDMFVMLSAWRRTRIQDPVAKRLGEAYSEAAVSITITTLTDMFSFLIGVITPFPSVQIFCIYTGAAVFMTYLWHITFFGACLAISGRFEANQKHALCGQTVKSKSRAELENGPCYSLWCAGGINKNDPWNSRDNKPHAVMVFFRDVVGNLLNMPLVKATVIFVFMLYLSGAIYGFLRIEEGLERRRLSRYDSYSTDFYDSEDKFFREYPYRIQVVVTGNLQYGDPKTKRELLDLHNRLENQSYVAGSLYTESWIRGWYNFLEDNHDYLEINVTDEKSFIENLRDLYLAGDDNIYKLDVKFNQDFSRIVASRFIIQTYRIRNSNEDKDMMEGLRNIAKESSLNVTVYHPLFIYFDQFMLVRITSLKAVCIAAAVMILVSLIFIPNPWCSLWVGFSIVSIEVGVVGYMTLWGVNLDTISMINLIMCIGFSVDFSAHVSYAYLSARANNPEERVRQCLFSLGFPILQGAISTIIGVSALVFAPSYIFITFFKTVFLVIFFGAIHGIFLLPVLLSILGPGTSQSHNKALPTNLKEYVAPSRLSPNPINIFSISGEMNVEAHKYYTRERRASSDDAISAGASSEESSGNSSLSKTTAEAIYLKANHEQNYHTSKYFMESYSNVGYVADEESVNISTRCKTILPSFDNAK